MPKAFGKDIQELICSLINYFEREHDAGGPMLPLTAVRERVANALNISLSAVSNVSKKMQTGEALGSPKRTGPTTKPVCDIDDFDQAAIRNVIYEMYRNKQHITRQSLSELLIERDIYKGSLRSLGKILEKIGFKFLKDNPRTGLMELPNIVFSRVAFLQNYINNISLGYPGQ